MPNALNQLIEDYISGEIKDFPEEFNKLGIKNSAIEVKHFYIAGYQQKNLLRAGEVLTLLLKARLASNKPFDLDEKALLRQLLNFLLEKHKGALHPFHETIDILENNILKLSDLPTDGLGIIWALLEYENLVRSQITHQIKLIVDKEVPLQKKVQELRKRKLTMLALEQELLAAAKAGDEERMQAALVVKGRKDALTYLANYRENLHKLTFLTFTSEQLNKELEKAGLAGDSCAALALLVLGAKLEHDEKNALVLAAADGLHNEETLKLLVSLDEVDPFALDWALSLAIESGRIAKVNILLQHPEISTVRLASRLQTAIMKNNLALIKVLLAHPLIDINAPRTVLTPLLGAINFGSHVEIVKLLLAHPKININAGYDPVGTPLECAVRKEDLVMINLLLEQPALRVVNTRWWDFPYNLLAEAHTAQQQALQKRTILWLDKTQGLLRMPAIPAERLTADLKTLQTKGASPPPNNFFSRLCKPQAPPQIERFFSKAINLLNDPTTDNQKIKEILRVIQDAAVTSQGAKRQSYGYQNTPEYCTGFGFIEDKKNPYWGAKGGTIFKFYGTTQSGFLMHHFCLTLMEVKQNPGIIAFKEKAAILYQELLKIHPTLPALKLFDVKEGFRESGASNSTIKFDTLSEDYTNQLNLILNKSYRAELGFKSQQTLRSIIHKMGNIISQDEKENVDLINSLIPYLLDGLDNNRWHHCWHESGKGLDRVDTALSALHTPKDSQTLRQVKATLFAKGRKIRQFITTDRQVLLSEISHRGKNYP